MSSYSAWTVWQFNNGFERLLNLCETFFSVVFCSLFHIFTRSVYHTYATVVWSHFFHKWSQLDRHTPYGFLRHPVIIFYKAWQNYATTHAICQNRNGLPPSRQLFLFANETFHQTVRVHLIIETLQPHSWNLELTSLYWLEDKTELKSIFTPSICLSLVVTLCDKSLKRADIWCAVVCGAVTGEDWDCGVSECDFQSVKRYRCGIVLRGFQLSAQIL